MSKKKRKKSFNSLSVWVAFAFGIAILGALFAGGQLARYEEGVIEIYATQQDAYVQLVLDQINLNREQKDESVIVNIIGTLDSSTNKYWTLSNDATILFVKDVTETNRYKGFTTETYYITDSAKEFIDGLSVNKVTHSLIDLGERNYIASGVVFTYQGENYQICLLTNPDAVLDHNAYLEAKINLSVMIGALLCVFLITVIALAGSCTKKARQLENEKENSTALSRMVEQLNEELSLNSLYDPRLAVFQTDFLPMLFEKLADKECLPVTLLLVEYDTDRALSFFLEDGYLMMDRRIIRFRDEKYKRLVLVAVNYDEKEAREAIGWLLGKEIRLAAVESVDSENRISLEQALENLYTTGEK